MTLTKKQILEQTEGGKKLFQLLLPDLKMVGDKNIENIDSPISKGHRCFSVYSWEAGIYYFKDHYSSVYGDIFEFIARLHKLDSRTDFKTILNIISTLLNENSCNIDYRIVEAFRNDNNQTELVLANKHNSQTFVEKNYLPNFPYFDSLPKYGMRLVESCSYVNERNERRFYNYDYSHPREAFYALTIKKGQFYILFNPFNRKCYKWGMSEEFYVLGQENLFSLAYCENVNLRNVIVVTNSIMGLLFLQDKGIPSVAFLDGETVLPEFFEREILPLYPNRYFLGETVKPKYQEQRDILLNVHNFNLIRTYESYLTSFFEKNSNPKDVIMDEFKVLLECDCYEYEGRKPNIISVTV